MTNLHAHIVSYSNDCDGGITRASVERFNDKEKAEHAAALAEGERLGWGRSVNDFSDIRFMNRVYTSHAGPFAVESMTVKVNSEGFNVYETTDEGHRAVEVVWCSDDCEDESLYRDHRAESMGY